MNHLKENAGNQPPTPIITQTPLNKNSKGNIKLKPLAGNASLGKLHLPSKSIAFSA